MDSVLAFSPASLPLELGVLLGEAACVGQNNPPKEKMCRAQGEDGIKRALHYTLDSGAVFQVIAAVRVLFKVIKVLKLISHLTHSS